MSTKSSVFKDLNMDDPEQMPSEIESFCVGCHENGVTRLLLTKIPFCKDVILASFECPHCGYRNNEVISGGKVQEHGTRFELNVAGKRDLDRQVVKSEYCMVAVPAVELEIPFGSQCGEITTVEGILSRVREGVGQVVSAQRNSDQEEKLKSFLEKMDNLINGTTQFVLVLDDPSGNSCIENPDPEKMDTQLTIVRYQRNLQQEKMLGLVADDVTELEGEGDTESAPIWESREAIRNEVLHFAVDCPNCKRKAQTNMKFVNIPYFKEVIIMATVCDYCGHKTNEVKPSGAISDRGVKLTVEVCEPEDLVRDVLKSENCYLYIPDLDLEVGPGILGGRFTTVEGLVDCLQEELTNSSMFALGDSAVADHKAKMTVFLAQLKEIAQGKMKCRLILDDPSGNSYIESLETRGPDGRLKVEFYDRTWEQNEELGLNQMNTEPNQEDVK